MLSTLLELSHIFGTVRFSIGRLRFDLVRGEFFRQLKYEGYKLSFIGELVNVAERMHLNAPQLGVISWDMTVDEKGKIVLIEVNTQSQTIWFPQMASGEPAFGDNTAAVLKYIAGR